MNSGCNGRIHRALAAWARAQSGRLPQAAQLQRPPRAVHSRIPRNCCAAKRSRARRSSCHGTNRLPTSSNKRAHCCEEASIQGSPRENRGARAPDRRAQANSGPLRYAGPIDGHAIGSSSSSPVRHWTWRVLAINRDTAV